MNKIVAILIERDGETQESAEELLAIARDEVAHGADPTDELEMLGLEPDYLFDLLGA